MDQIDHSVLLFDGQCNLCNGFVQFVIPRDPKKRFRFASLQSNFGQNLLQKNGLKTANLNTIVLIENGTAYTRSDVPIRLLPQLKGFWIWMKLGYLLPRFIRDGLYNWVAKNRYKWFGKKDECWIPTPDLKSRFLD